MATIVKDTYLGNKLYLRQVSLVQGTGAPTNGDPIVVNTRQYGLFTEYIDTATGKLWKRTALNGVAADFIDLTL